MEAFFMTDSYAAEKDIVASQQLYIYLHVPEDFP